MMNDAIMSWLDNVLIPDDVYGFNGENSLDEVVDNLYGLLSHDDDLTLRDYSWLMDIKNRSNVVAYLKDSTLTK